MSTRGRRRGVSLAIEVLLALLAGVVAYVLFAAVASLELPSAVMILAGAVYVVAVLAVSHYWGFAYAVPVGVAGVVALDWHYIPPTHASGLPDAQNTLALAAYLVTAVALGQLGELARARVVVSEAARGALADEQAALRRVATLVARQASSAEVFATVTDEVAHLLSTDVSSMLRYEPDLTATVLASHGDERARLPLGTRLSLEGDNVTARVYRTGKPARIESFSEASGPFAAQLRERGVRTAAGSPIVVEGRLWGVMVTASLRDPIPEGSETRISEFTELVATAIANAETRTALTESRARIVAASDETRRRIERDLHDGIQQRIVSLALDLHGVQALAPEQPEELPVALSQLATGLSDVVEELREISRGIHPAVLSQGGLQPALKSLARRSAVPIELDVQIEDRLPEQIEVAMYYAVSEAVTNAAKHAHASVVHVDVAAEDGVTRLEITDDGTGGADPGKGNGSGLVGLRDRVEAVGGRIEITSPSGQGTSLMIRIPTVHPESADASR